MKVALVLALVMVGILCAAGLVYDRMNVHWKLAAKDAPRRLFGNNPWALWSPNFNPTCWTCWNTWIGRALLVPKVIFHTVRCSDRLLSFTPNEAKTGAYVAIGCSHIYLACMEITAERFIEISSHLKQDAELLQAEKDARLRT